MRRNDGHTASFRTIRFHGARDLYLGNAPYFIKNCDEGVLSVTRRLGFELVESPPSKTNDAGSKRWVIVRRPRARTGVQLAKADEVQVSQPASVGKRIRWV